MTMKIDTAACEKHTSLARSKNKIPKIKSKFRQSLHTQKIITITKQRPSAGDLKISRALRLQFALRHKILYITYRIVRNGLCIIPCIIVCTLCSTVVYGNFSLSERTVYSGRYRCVTTAFWDYEQTFLVIPVHCVTNGARF